MPAHPARAWSGFLFGNTHLGPAHTGLTPTLWLGVTIRWEPSPRRYALYQCWTSSGLKPKFRATAKWSHRLWPTKIRSLFGLSWRCLLGHVNITWFWSPLRINWQEGSWKSLLCGTWEKKYYREVWKLRPNCGQWPRYGKDSSITWPAQHCTMLRIWHFFRVIQRGSGYSPPEDLGALHSGIIIYCAYIICSHIVHHLLFWHVSAGSSETRQWLRELYWPRRVFPKRKPDQARAGWAGIAQFKNQGSWAQLQVESGHF